MAGSLLELRTAPVDSQQDSSYLIPSTMRREILPTTCEIRRDPWASGEIEDLAKTSVAVREQSTQPERPHASLQNRETIKAANRVAVCHLTTENKHSVLICRESAII